MLDRELCSRSYRVARVALGTNTDPYQPCEAEYGVMREVLEVLWAHRHPVAITTKGTLIERDLDLLAPMAAAEGLLRVRISVTTLDRGLSRKMEPRAAAPKRRLEVIRRLSAAGVPVRAMLAPVVPGLSDHELSPCWRLWPGQGRRRRASSPCARRARFRRCFRIGWRCITQTGRPRSWPGCKSCTGAAIMTPSLANECGVRGSGLTRWRGALRLRRHSRGWPRNCRRCGRIFFSAAGLG